MVPLKRWHFGPVAGIQAWGQGRPGAPLLLAKRRAGHYGCEKQSVSDPRGELSLKSLTCGPFSFENEHKLQGLQGSAAEPAGRWGSFPRSPFPAFHITTSPPPIYFLQ